MKLPAPNGNHDGDVRLIAAEWVMRLDRGLTAAEQDRYHEWLAANPAHAAAVAAQLKVWESFDRLAGLQTTLAAVPDPHLLSPHPKDRRLRPRGRGPRVAMGWAAGGLIAGVIGMAVFWTQATGERRSGSPTPVAAGPNLGVVEERTLADGSIIRLNHDAALEVEYTATRRGVRLRRGEAAFEVARDPGRPFVVQIGGLEVRAVGTAFNVRVDERVVDVVVTQGTVAVSGAGAGEPRLEAGQRAVVPRDRMEGDGTFSTLTSDDLARLLAWQPRVLAFADERLAVIIGEFNRHNRVVLRAEGGALRDMRLSVRFRSDNLAGFLRVLEQDFGISATTRPDGEIVLRARP